jgi:D-glycero-alpha-D-manno-heptose-7-phosphate kinase
VHVPILPHGYAWQGGAVIEVSVPVRICDNGGWTDTWFGGPGRVVNVAIRPGIDVTLRATGGAPGVVVNGGAGEARHPIIEAAIDLLPPPAGVGLEVNIRSAVPPGCGAGTSAALAVALLSGLSTARAERCPPADVAYLAHRLEVEVLGLQSGIQDQLSAAFGGINYLEIEHYPEATVQNLGTWDQLEAGFTVVFLGRGHDSSDLHRQVIADLAGPGRAPALAQLRAAAVAARDSVLAQDLGGFGRSMIANADGQRSLHPELVGEDATRVFACAERDGALGWKVNGAGGDGGSVTILHATPAARDAFRARVPQLDPRYRILRSEISPVGLDIRGSLDP